MLIEELKVLIRNYRDSPTPTNGTIIAFWTENSEQHASIYVSLQKKFPNIGSASAVRNTVTRCVSKFKTLKKNLLRNTAQIQTFLAEPFNLPTASCPSTPTSSPRTSAPTPASPQTPEVNTFGCYYSVSALVTFKFTCMHVTYLL